MKTKQPWDDRVVEGDINNGQDAPLIIHRYERVQRGPTINVSKNSKGYTWEITYQGETPEETLAVIHAINAQLLAQYGK